MQGLTSQASQSFCQALTLVSIVCGPGEQVVVKHLPRTQRTHWRSACGAEGRGGGSSDSKILAMSSASTPSEAASLALSDKACTDVIPNAVSRTSWPHLQQRRKVVCH